MWPTSGGERTLTGSEAVLVANAIETMIDLMLDYTEVDDESDEETLTAALHTGISVYDGLSIGQRVAMLYQAAKHLLTPLALPATELSAVVDATIAAIYCEVRDRIEIEVDFFSGHDDPIVSPNGEGTSPVQWRRWVLNACRETIGPGEWDENLSDTALAQLPLDQWEDWIDYLVSSILWDRDFEFADSFLDANPDSARIRRHALGIEDDYFVSPAPDPTPAQLTRLIAQTRQLVLPFSIFSSGDGRPANDPPF